MENRNQLLKGIRPIILTEIEQSSVMESFQCNTLRPILKFQNALLLSVFKQHLSEHKMNAKDTSQEKLEGTIHTVLKKDAAIKLLMTGAVAGLFTEEELIIYASNKKEINKRIVELIIKRISDQKEKL